MNLRNQPEDSNKRTLTVNEPLPKNTPFLARKAPFLAQLIPSCRAEPNCGNEFRQRERDSALRCAFSKVFKLMKASCRLNIGRLFGFDTHGEAVQASGLIRIALAQGWDVEADTPGALSKTNSLLPGFGTQRRPGSSLAEKVKTKRAGWPS